MCIIKEELTKLVFTQFFCASVKRFFCVNTTILVSKLPNYEIKVWQRVDPGHSPAAKLCWENPEIFKELKWKTKKYIYI